MSTLKIKHCDCMELLDSLADDSVDCIVTSPPYNKGLFQHQRPTNQVWRNFQIQYNSYSDDMPLEDYERWMTGFIDTAVRKLKPTGSLFLNHKPIRHDNRIYHPLSFILKSSANIYQEIIWDRKNSPNIRKEVLLPCTERVYWLVKGKPKVFRDSLPRNFIGEVWSISAKPMKEHPAPFPERLVENCVLLSTEPRDLVIDPFCGSGTAGVVCKKLGRDFIGCDTSEEYCRLSMARMGIPDDPTPRIQSGQEAAQPEKPA